MYEAFDQFLRTDTWHTGHDTDRARFFTALAGVVENPDFNADTMGDHMRAAKRVDRDNPDHVGYESAIENLVSDASAVRDYLDANRR